MIGELPKNGFVSTVFIRWLGCKNGEFGGIAGACDHFVLFRPGFCMNSQAHNAEPKPISESAKTLWTDSPINSTIGVQASIGVEQHREYYTQGASDRLCG